MCGPISQRIAAYVLKNPAGAEIHFRGDPANSFFAIRATRRAPAAVRKQIGLYRSVNGGYSCFGDRIGPLTQPGC